jgi:hypothetical protein
MSQGNTADIGVEVSLGYITQVIAERLERVLMVGREPCLALVFIKEGCYRAKDPLALSNSFIGYSCECRV